MVSSLSLQNNVTESLKEKSILTQKMFSNISKRKDLLFFCPCVFSFPEFRQQILFSSDLLSRDSRPFSFLVVN